MSSLDDYLSKHPELNQDDPDLVADAEGIRLDVVIRGISQQFVKFAHMGTNTALPAVGCWRSPKATTDRAEPGPARRR